MNNHRKTILAALLLASFALASCKLVPSSTASSDFSSEGASSDQSSTSSDTPGSSSSDSSSSDSSSSSSSSSESASSSSSSSSSSSNSSSSSTSSSSSGSSSTSSSSGSSSNSSSSSSSSPSGAGDGGYELSPAAEAYWAGVPMDGSVYGAAFRLDLYKVMNRSSATNSYKGLKKILAKSDPCPSGGVHPFYRGPDERAGGWNKEHVWPNSRGAGEKSGYAGTDPQVIRPTNSSDNSSRSNYMYNEVPSGTKVTSSTGWDPNSFGYEAARGESSRIILYAATRYYEESTAGAGGSSHGDKCLELTENINEASSEHTMGKLSKLLEWNDAYPVTASEIYRNDYLAEQGYARNPFIDCPDLANFIWTADSSLGGVKGNNYMRTVSYTPNYADY